MREQSVARRAAPHYDPGVPRVVVVTVTYNSTPVLPGFLDGFAALAECCDVQLCLVDNASGDGTAAAARRLLAERGVDSALVFEQTANAGWGAGNNRGVREAPPCEFFLFLNPDVVLDPDALAALLAAVDAEPGAAAAVPRLRAPGGTLRAPVFPWHTLADSVLGMCGWRRLRHRRLQRRLAPRSDTVPLTAGYAEGSCLLLRAEVLAAIGGFDERFHLFFDDADLGRRLRDAHAGALLVGGAVARDLGGKGSRAAPGGTRADERLQRFVAHLRAELRYYDKWWGRRTARRLALYKKHFELPLRAVWWRLGHGVRGLAPAGRGAVDETLASWTDGAQDSSTSSISERNRASRPRGG